MAGHFLFPILRNWDKNKKTLLLETSDKDILCRLIALVGQIISNLEWIHMFQNSSEHRVYIGYAWWNYLVRFWYFKLDIDFIWEKYHMKNISKLVQKRFLDISNTRVKYFGTVKDSRTFHWWCWDAFELGKKLENLFFGVLIIQRWILKGKFHRTSQILRFGSWLFKVFPLSYRPQYQGPCELLPLKSLNTFNWTFFRPWRWKCKPDKYQDDPHSREH